MQHGLSSRPVNEYQLSDLLPLVHVYGPSIYPAGFYICAVFLKMLDNAPFSDLQIISKSRFFKRLLYRPKNNCSSSARLPNYYFINQ